MRKSKQTGGGGGYLLKSKSIIDAGAYIGDSAVVFAEYTDKKVYSFEPSPINYKLLLKTIELNNLQDKIIPVQKAVGDREMNLSMAGKGAGSQIVLESQSFEKSSEIQMTTLDNFVKENNIEAGLIKTDLEGFEQNFLKGAIETIKKQKPILLLSIYHNASDFFEIKPLIESWNLGYKFKIRKFEAKSVIVDTMLICEI